jgi:hypothetical protein
MTQELIEQQAAVIEQMQTDIKYAIKIGHISGIGKTQLERTLALQPSAEVLAKVKADTVAKFAKYADDYEVDKLAAEYTQSLLKGEV